MEVRTIGMGTELRRKAGIRELLRPGLDHLIAEVPRKRKQSAAESMILMTSAKTNQ